MIADRAEKTADRPGLALGRPLVHNRIAAGGGFGHSEAIVLEDGLLQRCVGKRLFGVLHRPVVVS